MSLSAIATGAVDLVLPTSKICDALIRNDRSMVRTATCGAPAPRTTLPDWLAQIIGILRNNTAHDFTLYKPGTISRRILRRMGLRGIVEADAGRYIDILHNEPEERDLLAKDLLINVTNSFRDAAVFEMLGKTILPELVLRHATDQPVRVWVAGSVMPIDCRRNSPDAIFGKLSRLCSAEPCLSSVPILNIWP